MKLLLPVWTLMALYAATPCAAATRLLTCSRNTSSVVFSICGARGCTASVINNGAESTVFKVSRKKQTNGALVYSTSSRSKRKCSFTISPLSQGIRRISNTPVCARGLKRGVCSFSDPS
jgi:hypothetical protein